MKHTLQVAALLILVALVACPQTQGDPPLPPTDDDDSSPGDDDDLTPAGDDDSAGDDDDSAGDDDDSAGDDDDSAGDDDDSASWSEQQHRGAALYGQYCSLCHGSNGEGYQADEANALSNEAFLSAATDDFLRGSISHGRPGTPMSAWSMDYAGPLSPQDIDDVVAFMRTWQEHTLPGIHSTVISGDPSAAEPIYQQHCESCHGIQGQGATAVSIANPWFLELASDGFLLHAIDVGRPGTLMAAWDPVLSQSERHNLVALLRSWAIPVEDTKVPPFNPDLTDHLINPGGTPADFSADLTSGLFVGVDRVYQSVAAGEELIVLDARPGSDYLAGHISGSISVPFYRMDEAIGLLPQDRWIITYCGCPHTLSSEAATSLQAAGFTQVAVLDEGYYTWLGNGHPTTSGSTRY